MRYKPLDACQDCGRHLDEKECVKHPRTGELRPTLCTQCGDKLRAAIRGSNASGEARYSHDPKGAGLLHRAGRLKGRTWRFAAGKWFHELAIKSALGKATEKDRMILDRLQRIRVPRSQAEIVAESRANWQIRCLMKRLRALEYPARKPTTEITGREAGKE